MLGGRSAVCVSSERARIEIHANQIHRLPWIFRRWPLCRSGGGVEDLMRWLHAPARTIVTLLREGRLIVG